MQVNVHWEGTNAVNVGDGDIGLKIVHPPTRSVIEVDEDNQCVGRRGGRGRGRRGGGCWNW